MAKVRLCDLFELHKYQTVISKNVKGEQTHLQLPNKQIFPNFLISFCCLFEKWIWCHFYIVLVKKKKWIRSKKDLIRSIKTVPVGRKPISSRLRSRYGPDQILSGPDPLVIKAYTAKMYFCGLNLSTLRMQGKLIANSSSSPTLLLR